MVQEKLNWSFFVAEEESKRAIEKLVGDLVTAWNRHDPGAYAETFAEDADFTNVFGVHIKGRALIEENHAYIFKTMFGESRITEWAAETRLLSDAIASVDVRWRMIGAKDPKGNPWPERHGLLSAVVTKSSDGWRFA